jgi:hypothetical protein
MEKLEGKAAKGKRRFKNIKPLPSAVLVESPTRQSASLPGSVEEMSAEETPKTDLLSSAESTSGISTAAGDVSNTNDHHDPSPARMKELLQAPSIGQIKTFQQRAWSSKEFLIELHKRVAEMSLDEQLDKEEQKRNLYHLIHQRDHDVIRAIIDIATMDNKETRTHEESKKREEMLMLLKRKILEEPLKTAAPGVKPFLAARLPFKAASRNVSRMRTAHILQVPGTGKGEEDIFNVHLVRYFVEKVWKLERPDVIISVTGGASKNFDLRPEYNEKLMRGMMEGTRKLKTWSVSIYVCISFLSVCGYCVVHMCCVRACCARLCQRTPAAANV